MRSTVKIFFRPSCPLFHGIALIGILKTFTLDLFIRVSKYSKASCKIIKSVNYWRNSFKNKKYLYSPSFHIHKLFTNRTT